MDQELKFAKTLEQIKKTARQQGNWIAEEQVREAFADLSLEPEKLDMVFDYLKKSKIGINEPVDLEEALEQEERDYLKAYLEEIAELPSCTPGEREAFTISAMAGDCEAQKRLMESCLKEVAEIARLYAGQGVYMEDLIGEGNVALAMGVTMLGSLEEPGEAQGMLGRLIMDAMERYIEENTANEKKDQRIADKVNRVADKARELSEELRRKVTVEELSKETGLSEKTIRDAMRMSGFQIEEIEGA